MFEGNAGVFAYYIWGMSLQIIPADFSDADEIASLVNSAYRGDSARQGWTHEAEILDGTRTDGHVIREILNEPGHQILKYIKDGEIVGCVEIMYEHNRLYLGMLTVRPDLQGRGIGKALMSAVELRASERHCKSIFMTVISVRHELIEWYKRHGYLPTGEKKPFNFTDPRFGQPKQNLEFLVLEKKIQLHAT